jgi:hypothetical protein
MSLSIFFVIFSINIKIDLINKTLEELIEFCKEKEINY